MIAPAISKLPKPTPARLTFFATGPAVFVGAFLLYLGVVLGNAAVFPGFLNQLTTVLAILVLWLAIFDAEVHLAIPPTGLAFSLLSLAALLVHSILLSPVTPLGGIQTSAFVRLLGLVAPLIWGAYLIGVRGLGEWFMRGALFASIASIPVVLLAPETVDEHHVAVGRLFMLGAALSLNLWASSSVLSLSLYLVHLVAAFASGSRGAVIGAVVSLALVAACSVTTLRAIFKVCALGTGAVLAYISGFLESTLRLALLDGLGFAETGVVGRQSRLFVADALLEDQSAISRLDLGWRPVLERFDERPFFGWGLGASARPDTEPWFAPHNILAEGLVSFGIVGLLAVLIFTMIGVRTAVCLARNDRFVGLSAAIFSWLISIQISGTLVLNRTAYLLVALGVGVLHNYRKQMACGSPEIGR